MVADVITPPVVGSAHRHGLNAAALVRFMQYYAARLGQLLRNVDLVKRNLNPQLEVSTIVRDTAAARSVRQVVNEVLSTGDKVCKTVVRSSSGIGLLLANRSSRSIPTLGRPHIEQLPEVSGGPAERTR